MITGNDPVNPIISEETTSQYSNYPDTVIRTINNGITIRQHFAAMAMQGLLAKAASGHIDDFAEVAVSAADALIKELNK